MNHGGLMTIMKQAAQAGSGGDAMLSEWKEQAERTCESLLQSGQWVELTYALLQLPHDMLQHNQTVLRSRVLLAFHARDYVEVYRLLQAHEFEPRHHDELQQVWFEAHYKQAEEKLKGPPLTAWERSELRMCFPPPRTIWDGVHRLRMSPTELHATLMSHFAKNRFPDMEARARLAEQTGLSFGEVTDWFLHCRCCKMTPGSPSKASVSLLADHETQCTVPAAAESDSSSTTTSCRSPPAKRRRMSVLYHKVHYPYPPHLPPGPPGTPLPLACPPPRPPRRPRLPVRGNDLGASENNN